ncbi:envelope-like protein [Trifolium pratense]|uniref:Envelope-like protein n=1 Tax=Trifolium pratense TaxID=57577 RepID=A0A2K3LN38_TRIPR|nr:envelope-like protein [Trifolium pratense]
MIQKIQKYKKVFDRGRCTKFSLAVVNEFLGRSREDVPEMKVSNDEICKTLTNNTVRKWPGNIQSAKLTAEYALLNEIGVTNWALTSHTSEVTIGMAKFIYAIGTRTPLDFGTYIFDQTLKHGKTLDVQFPIVVPTLLCGIILSLHPDICTATDVPCAREAACLWTLDRLKGHMLQILLHHLSSKQLVYYLECK